MLLALFFLFLHPAPWNKDIIAGALAVMLDHEVKYQM